MTNREAYEEASGMKLDDMFFKFNGINPDVEWTEISVPDEEYRAPRPTTNLNGLLEETYLQLKMGGKDA